ncbi:adenylate/guanylate cyclase family protein [Rhizobium azibense]|nr:adenylate/guanylate cyclase family protein [Rhizobium azibense]
MDRKLAAILAADVVGYSTSWNRTNRALSSACETGRKELFEPEIACHHGRIFKLMGDGLLAEFASVVDAVECAVILQRGLAERNTAVPEDERNVRIGVNLGEVIVEGDDFYGEGVNIAARLEQMAEPGGVYVSGKVAKEVGKKLSFASSPPRTRSCPTTRLNQFRRRRGSKAKPRVAISCCKKTDFVNHIRAISSSNRCMKRRIHPCFSFRFRFQDRRCLPSRQMWHRLPRFRHCASSARACRMQRDESPPE